MLGIHYRIKSICLLLLIVFVLPACVQGTNTTLSLSNGLDSFDYNPYLKKIWVVEEYDHIDIKSQCFSFHITKIENGIIQGKFVVGETAIPDFYYYRWNSRLGDFAGVIENDEAKCAFVDTWLNLNGNNTGHNGNLILKFVSDNKIEGSINYLGEKDIYGNDLPNGQFTFKPYKYSDLKYVDFDESKSFETELDSWGNVKFITCFSNTNKPSASALITNMNDDILYVFYAPFQTGVRITDVKIEDMNGDGLKDVYLTTDAESITWTFYQLENGWFYDSNLPSPPST